MNRALRVPIASVRQRPRAVDCQVMAWVEDSQVQILDRVVTGDTQAVGLSGDNYDDRSSDDYDGRRV